jgi:chitinase
MLTDRKKTVVDNPKAVVDADILNIDKLVGIALVAYWEMQTGFGDADFTDVVLSHIIPVFMPQEASKLINEIEDIGQEQKESKTRDLVFMVLSIVFSVVLFAGQSASALGSAAAIARAALLIGEAGNAAPLPAEVAHDPDSAPWLMLGVLLGAVPGAGARPCGSFRSAADLRCKLDEQNGPGVTKFQKSSRGKMGWYRIS